MPRRVLFLPGASGAGAFWEPVARAFPATWETVLLDWPGLGAVPPDPRVSRFEDLVDLVLARLGQEPADLVAQSMGGVVAALVALRRPDLVRRLVLTATSGGVDVARLGGSDWRPDFRRGFPASASWVTEYRVDLTDRLPTIQTPTLLLWTDRDDISPTAVGEHLATLLPHSRLVVVPGGDHGFARDRAAEVAPHILAHLEAMGDASCCPKAEPRERRASCGLEGMRPPLVCVL